MILINNTFFGKAMPQFFKLPSWLHMQALISGLEPAGEKRKKNLTTQVWGEGKRSMGSEPPRTKEASSHLKGTVTSCRRTVSGEKTVESTVRTFTEGRLCVPGTDLNARN